MKAFIYILLLQFAILFASAQRVTIDSLKNVLQTATPDTNKVILLAALSYQYLYSNPDSAILFAQNGYTLAQQLNFLKGEALCLNRMAVPNAGLGNAPKALELLQKARVIAEKINDETEVARSVNNIADFYTEQGEYAKALSYLFRAKELSAIIQNLVFSAIVLENIGECYSQLNRLDSGLLYAQQAYELSRQQQDNALTGDIQKLLGDIQAKKNNQALALKYYRESIANAIETEDLQHASISYLSIANFYQKAGQPDSAIFYAQKGLKTAQTGSFTKNILNASQLLAGIFENKHQYADAYRYFKISTTAKDSLFSQEKVKQLLTLGFEEKIKQQEIEAANNQLRDRIKIYTLLGGLAVLLSVSIILVRNNRNKQKAYTLLQKQKQQTDVQKAKAEQAFQELKTTQAQLIQSEKMASLGQLTAGIAHEIQNPLNFVNNFSEINTELIIELEEEADSGNIEEVKAIAKDIKDNEQKIIHHGKRADSIVKGMLQHSRVSTGKRELTDINALIDECLRLSYHGMRAKDKELNAAINTVLDESVGKVSIVPQDISRVLLNLLIDLELYGK